MACFSEMGRRPAKSRFSLTCNLLSQYIKERGCTGELGLGMTTRSLDPNPIGESNAYRPPTTMSLLPGLDASGIDISSAKEDLRDHNSTKSILISSGTSSSSIYKQPEKPQLTIFYGGKVLVFDNFPAEKAEDLMQLASKTSALGSQNFPLSPLCPGQDRASCSAPSTSQAIFPPSSQPNFAGLPIARKASLHRFLEKRKDRLASKTPYQLSSSEGGGASVKMEMTEDAGKPWLGLGQEISHCSSS